MPATLTHAARGRYTPPVPTRRIRITSAIYAVFTVAATAFVVASTYQIAGAVLSEPAPDAAAPAAVPVSPACAAEVRTLAIAVDRGVTAAASATDRGEAQRLYRAARTPEWDDAKQRALVGSCAEGAHGAEAVAAVTRLDRAAEGAIRRQIDELGPVRRAVDSFIR
jgi:hypothetical protein